MPTTLAGVELCLVCIVLGLRVTDVVQLLVAGAAGLRLSTRPVLDGALMLAYFAESIWFSQVLARVRRYVSPRIAITDTFVAAAITAAQPWFTAAADRVGTWTAWGFPISIGAAIGAGVGFPHRRQTIYAVTALSVAYAAASLPAVTVAGNFWTVLSNTVGLAACGLFGRALAGYLRRLGTDADAAREQAAQAAEENMLRRQRDFFHDQETVLRMLADPRTDSSLNVQLRGQATTAANQIRRFLTGPLDLSASGTLVAAVHRAATPFSDLAIIFSTDLAVGVRLSAELGDAVHSAVTTLLHNIQRHAQAQEVVLHADIDEQEMWELTIRDDGIGFNHDWSAAGYGLTHQVRDALARFGGTVSVESSPGNGSCVTLRCPLEAIS